MSQIKSPAEIRKKLVESKGMADRFRCKLATLEREVLLVGKERLERQLRELRVKLTHLRKHPLKKSNARKTGCDDAGTVASQERKQIEDERKRVEIEELIKRNKEMEDALKAKQDQERRDRVAPSKEDTRKRVEDRALKNRNETIKNVREAKLELDKIRATAQKAEEARKRAANEELEKRKKELEKLSITRRDREIKEAAEKTVEEARKLAANRSLRRQNEVVRKQNVEKQWKLDEEQRKQENVELKNKYDEARKKKAVEARKKRGDGARKKKVEEATQIKASPDKVPSSVYGKGEPIQKPQPSPKKPSGPTPRQVPFPGYGKGEPIQKPQPSPKKPPRPTTRQEGEGDRGWQQRSLLPRHFNNLDAKSCYANCGIQCLLSFDELRHSLRRFGANDLKVLHNLALDFEAKESPYRYDVIPLRMAMGGDFAKANEEDTIFFVSSLADRSRKVQKQIEFETLDYIKCGCANGTTSQHATWTSLILYPYRYLQSNKGCKSLSIQDLLEREFNFNVGAPRDKCDLCHERRVLKTEVIIPSNIFVLNISRRSEYADGRQDFRVFTMDITGIADGTPIIIGGAMYLPIAAVFHRGRTTLRGHYYCYIKNGSSWTFADDKYSTTTIKDWPKPCLDLSLLWLEKVQDSAGPAAPMTPPPSKTQEDKAAIIRRHVEKQPRRCPGTYFDNRISPAKFVVNNQLQSYLRIDRGTHLKWDADVFHDIVLPPNTISEFIKKGSREGKESEFIGKLFGYPLSCIGVMVVTHLLIPDQTAHVLKTNIISHYTTKGKPVYFLATDIWSKDDEKDSQAGVDFGDVMQVGWIRAKTSGECLMSSRDLHRQAHYQKIQKDSVGFICTNIDQDQVQPRIQCYTLTEFGMKDILKCPGLADDEDDDVCNQIYSRAKIHEGKHVHSLVAKIAKHVATNENDSFALKIEDLRRSS